MTENEQLRVALHAAQEQQAATSEILRVIGNSSTNVQPVFDAIVRHAARLCGADFSGLALADGDWMTLPAVYGLGAADRQTFLALFPIRLGSNSVSGRAIIQGQVTHVTDQAADPIYAGNPGQRVGTRSIVAVPMLNKGHPIGAVSAWRREVRPFTETEIALLKTFADQAVIAIENVRLFKELESRNTALTESLDQQTATAEVLTVMSRSPSDIQPVFDAIVQSAVRLCDGLLGTVLRVDGNRLDLAAHFNVTSEGVQAYREHYPMSIGRETVAGNAILDRRVIHVVDAQEDATVPLRSATMARAAGFRGVVAVPLLREGEPLGVINVARREPGPFSDRQITVIQIFANQAVLAIENVRLFTALRERTAQLGRTVDELADKSRQLEAASQHKSEFLANMSHELRTPLNAVIGFSEVLRDRMFGELNDKQEEYLNDIHAAGQHLLSLINDILDLSKVEAGRMELELTEFHLPAALDNVLTLVRERAGRRGIALHAAVDDRIDYIQADERKIKQVLLNLLSNAIKFTPEGGRIELHTTLGDGAIEVSVRDTGVGIAPGDQDAIFEEFRQVGTAAKHVEGTGLGLTLSRRFIELHGGRIWVKSEVGVGSTFAFTLPRVIDPDRPASSPTTSP